MHSPVLSTLFLVVPIDQLNCFYGQDLLNAYVKVTLSVQELLHRKKSFISTVNSPSFDAV